MNQEVTTPETAKPAQPSSSVLIIGTIGDRNTILAALRFYLERGMDDPEIRSEAIHDLATNGGEDISYDAGDIDDLCVRVNCAASEITLADISAEDLFSEIRRRKVLSDLHSASAALYNELERQGLLSGGSEIAKLMFCLKREEAKTSGLNDASYLQGIWQRRLEQLEVPTT